MVLSTEQKKLLYHKKKQRIPSVSRWNGLYVLLIHTYKVYNIIRVDNK